MNKDLLIKDGLLFVVFACVSAGTLLVNLDDTNKFYGGIGLYVLAALLVALRSYLKTKELTKVKK